MQAVLILTLHPPNTFHLSFASALLSFFFRLYFVAARDIAISSKLFHFVSVFDGFCVK